jgi:ATP-dependent HslUV protease subunit HslV
VSGYLFSDIGGVMTTIAYRDGILAADSRATFQSEEGGARCVRCRKIYRKKTKAGIEVLIGTAGESSSGLLFVDWYGSDRKPPIKFLDGDADFLCLVVTPSGVLEYDKWCRGEEVEEEFAAIGSGAKAALGALYAGASAEEAVRIACKIDPYSSEPIYVEKL